MMNGIIVINKPAGWTSFDVVAKLRGVLHQRQIGHGGTLDPMATGVLPLFLGKAAKASDMLPIEKKAYLAAFRLGERTDTLDISGKLLERCEVAAKKSDISALLERFRGRITQLPPMYSAVKVDGKKLYQYAREGKEVVRRKREAFVYTLRLESYDENTHEGTLFIECSKGTYVRTIIDDLGKALGCGGVMTALLRTSSGGFSLENSYTLEEVIAAAEKGEAEKLLIPVDSAFNKVYPSFKIGKRECMLYKNGVKLRPEQVTSDSLPQGNFLIFDDEGGFLGICRLDDEGLVRQVKNFY